MTAKIYRFPRPAPLPPEITFIGCIALLAAMATLLSVVAPWS